MQDNTARYQEFAQLGRGGQADSLSFRLILRLLWRCLPLLRTVRGPLAGLVACGAILIALFAVPVINVVNIFWNGVLEGGPLSDLQATMIGLDTDRFSSATGLSVAARKEVLRHLVWSVAGLLVALTPIFIGLVYWRIWILQRVNQNLRILMIEKLQALSLRFHDEQRVGDSIYRLFQDSAMVTQLINVLFLSPLETISRFLFTLGLVFLWDPRLALLLMLAWPPLFYLGHRFARPMRVGFRHAREANSRLTSIIQETLAGLKTIKAYGAEGSEKKRFSDASLEAFTAAYAARNRFVGFKVLTFWCVGLTLVIGVGFATGLSASEAPLYGEQFMISMGFAAANSGVWNLGFYNNFKDRFGDGTHTEHHLLDLWGTVQDVATGLDRTFELLDLESDIEDAAGAIPITSLSHGVRYRNVSFSYESKQKTLDEIDFDVPIGSIVAIVGPTGSGKTTLMSLLLRLYDPDQGSIEFDGRDIREFTRTSLRENVSIALQENILFGDTVAENIRYAVPHASDERVREAAEIACALDFVAELPKGFETQLGERGTKLSTGQRQRISIARAILKDTPILILDEPTASLDAETEHRVLQNLARWADRRIVFLITHRLSTIRHADRVAVIRNGRLIEWGDPQQLIEKDDGAYRRLANIEAGKPLRTEPANSQTGEP